MQKSFFLKIILLTLVLFSCTSNPLEVDTSSIELELVTHRLDREFFEAEASELSTLNQTWLEKYGQFYKEYVEVLLNEGSVNNPMINVNLSRFRNDAEMEKVYHEIQTIFGDLEAEKAALTEGFKRYRHHFPDSLVPEIVFFHSGFVQGVYATDSTLGIGLDRFLGPEHESVKRIPTDAVPQFVKDKMKREFLVTDAARGWVAYKFYKEDAGKDFLSTIVFFGKIMYVVDAMYPNVADQIKINYTPGQLQWCVNNEMNIWQKLVEDKLLFTTDENKIMKYITDGPFTSGLPQESPSRVGIWLGWQMVRAYMNDHSNLSVEDLVNEKNSQKILKSYKPNK